MTEEAEPKGQKRNIIMTYDELAGIHMAVQKIDGKVDLTYHEVKRIGEEHTDHEIRIRALELSQARSAGGHGLAQWATPIILTIIGTTIAVLNFIK